MCAINIYNF